MIISEQSIDCIQNIRNDIQRQDRRLQRRYCQQLAILISAHVDHHLWDRRCILREKKVKFFLIICSVNKRTLFKQEATMIYPEC